MEAQARAEADHDPDYDDYDEYERDPVPGHDARDHDDAREYREHAPYRRGRGGFDPEADAIARATRYAFRQRAVLGLVFAAIMTGALALIVSSAMWWACTAAVVGLLGYLAYLRRQVQIEQEIRRRRMARLSRSRLGVESHDDDELRLVPPRLRRRGAVVLEVDDEDPAFDHLDHYDAHFETEEAPHEVRRVVGE